MADSAPKIIIFFTISLLFTSIFTSWLLLQIYGVGVAGLPQDLFLSPSISESYDIKNGQNVTDTTEYGDWEFQAGVGYVSTAENDYYLFNKQSTSESTTIISTYKLQNPNSEDYSIVISKSGFGTQEISVEYDGYHLMQYGAFSDTPIIGSILSANELYFYPYAGANQNPTVNIKTEYCSACINSDTGDVIKYYVDGSLRFTIPSEVIQGFGGQPSQMTSVYYGGVGSKNNIGLIIEGLQTSLSVDEDITDSDALLSFMFTLFKLLTWGIDSQYLPYEINLLLIKTQEFGILVGIIGLYWR